MTNITRKWLCLFMNCRNMLIESIFLVKRSIAHCTGKSFSEALILHQLTQNMTICRLFIEFPEEYKFTKCCVQKSFFCFCFNIQSNICTKHVVNLYFSWNSMNNLLSYCGLTGARMRASEKDLPVH